MRLRPPTLPSFTTRGNFVNLKTSSPLNLVTTLLLWDMEDMYGTTKVPYQYLKVVGMPSKQMIFSKSLTIGVICRRCIILSYSHPSCHGRVCSSIWKGCLWMMTTNLGIPMMFNFIKHWNTLSQINVIKNINIE